MFKNYLKTALRSIANQKGYTLINITGLAIGMACCLLIFMFVNDELSYDNYNEKADRIHRIAGFFRFGGRDLSMATVSPPMGQAMVNEYPEVENSVRIRYKGGAVVTYGENSFREKKIAYTDPSLFSVFTIPLLAGDPKTALKDPYTLVISKKAARKYFGRENPLGKILKLDNKDDYKVTAVFDKIPHNSHFHYDIIASLATLPDYKSQFWLNNAVFTYLLLDKHARPKLLEAKIPELIKKYMAPQVEKIMGKPMDKLDKSGTLKVNFFLQPLRDIHLHSHMMYELDPNGDIKYVFIFTAIALFILIIASINFINLSTARSANRAKETGIRKLMGAFRTQLVWQFLVESIVLSIISMLIAIVLINLALPFFNNLSGKELTTANIFNLRMVAIIFGITLVTGALAGAYPAFFLSAFRQVNDLNGQTKFGGKNVLLRRVLVVFQFIASILFIIGTLVVMNQLHYIRDMKLGFNKDQVLILHNANLLGNQAETFKNEMLKNPQVKSATISAFLPVPSKRSIGVVSPQDKVASKETTTIQSWLVDYDYLEVLGMKLDKGRNFSKDFSTDESAVIINQEALQHFAWDNALGKKLFMKTCKDARPTYYTVIGVVKDFHFESLRSAIAPMAMVLGNSNDLISFRLNTREIARTIELLRDKWNKFLPGHPFEYSFMDERFNEVYRSDQKIGKIFGTCAFLAILIGCLGLFGLAAFISERRTREIGIRKVLGASVSNIIRLLSKEFILLVGIANIIAWPTAYFIMNKWLEDFAYRTMLSIWSFLAVGIITVIIAVAAVSYQTIKSALANPVDTIKYE
jgi:putative ABC transport system permease protein